MEERGRSPRLSAPRGDVDDVATMREGQPRLRRLPPPDQRSRLGLQQRHDATHGANQDGGLRFWRALWVEQFLRAPHSHTPSLWPRWLDHSGFHAPLLLLYGFVGWITQQGVAGAAAIPIQAMNVIAMNSLAQSRS